MVQHLDAGAPDFFISSSAPAPIDSNSEEHVPSKTQNALVLHWAISFRIHCRRAVFVDKAKNQDLFMELHQRVQIWHATLDLQDTQAENMKEKKAEGAAEFLKYVQEGLQAWSKIWKKEASTRKVQYADPQAMDLGHASLQTFLGQVRAFTTKDCILHFISQSACWLEGDTDRSS